MVFHVSMLRSSTLVYDHPRYAQLYVMWQCLLRHLEYVESSSCRSVMWITIGSKMGFHHGNQKALQCKLESQKCCIGTMVNKARSVDGRRLRLKSGACYVKHHTVSEVKEDIQFFCTTVLRSLVLNLHQWIRVDVLHVVLWNLLGLQQCVF